MNVLQLIAGFYGLAGAFLVVRRKIGLRLRLSSKRDTIRHGQFNTQIDPEGSELYIEVLGFLLIGCSFFVGTVSEFVGDLALGMGVWVALGANLIAVADVYLLSGAYLSRYENDQRPFPIPLNVPGKLLIIVGFLPCFLLLPISLLSGLPWEDWVLDVGLWGVPIAMPLMSWDLIILAPRLLGRDRAYSGWTFLTFSLLLVAIGCVGLLPIVPFPWAFRLVFCFTTLEFGMILQFLSIILP